MAAALFPVTHQHRIHENFFVDQKKRRKKFSGFFVCFFFALIMCRNSKKMGLGPEFSMLFFRLDWRFLGVHRNFRLKGRQFVACSTLCGRVDGGDYPIKLDLGENTNGQLFDCCSSIEPVKFEIVKMFYVIIILKPKASKFRKNISKKLKTIKIKSKLKQNLTKYFVLR